MQKTKLLLYWNSLPYTLYIISHCIFYVYLVKRLKIDQSTAKYQYCMMLPFLGLVSLKKPQRRITLSKANITEENKAETNGTGRV